MANCVVFQAAVIYGVGGKKSEIPLHSDLLAWDFNAQIH
jgi:hypothetical protein